MPSLPHASPPRAVAVVSGVSCGHQEGTAPRQKVVCSPTDTCLTVQVTTMLLRAALFSTLAAVALGQAPVNGNLGGWSNVLQMPVIAVAAALREDGRVRRSAPLLRMRCCAVTT